MKVVHSVEMTQKSFNYNYDFKKNKNNFSFIIFQDHY